MDHAPNLSTHFPKDHQFIRYFTSESIPIYQIQLV